MTGGADRNLVMNINLIDGDRAVRRARRRARQRVGMDVAAADEEAALLLNAKRRLLLCGYRKRQDHQDDYEQTRHHSPPGVRRCHSVACSNARASASTSESPRRGPVICRPIGSPARLKPQGIEIVGSPKISNGCVLRSEGATPPGGGTVGLLTASSTVCGRIGVVGVTRRSTFENTPATARRRRSSSRRPSIYADDDIREPPSIR